MKRFTISAEINAEAVTVPSQGRIKIDESPNGEWVRYEDVTDTKQFVEMSNALQDMKTYYREQSLLMQQIKKARDEYDAAPGYANWQEKQKLSSLLGMIK